MEKKEKQAVWLYPRTKELIIKHMDEANARSQSEFIENAIKFYSAAAVIKVLLNCGGVILGKIRPFTAFIRHGPFTGCGIRHGCRPGLRACMFFNAAVG